MIFIFNNLSNVMIISVFHLPVDFSGFLVAVLSLQPTDFGLDKILFWCACFDV